MCPAPVFAMRTATGAVHAKGETMRRILYATVALLTSAAVLPSSGGAASTLPTPHAKKVIVVHHRAQPRVKRVVHRPTLLSYVATLARVTVNQLRAEWQHVAICEVGGNWSMQGPVYSGIGFANSTWSEYGGTQFAPLAGQAPRDAQILIGMRVTGGWVPDQNGCAPGGW